MLNINDLETTKNLEAREMARVRGGYNSYLYSLYGGNSVDSKGSTDSTSDSSTTSTRTYPYGYGYLSSYNLTYLG